MAGIVDQILLNIQAAVTGQAQVAALTTGLGSLGQATGALDGRFRDINGRLREANGRFVTGAAATGGLSGGLLSAASGAGRLNMGLGQLNLSLLNLNAGLQIVNQVVAGVQQLTGTMKGWADAANKAATDTQVFELTLSRFGVSADGANAAAGRLAAKFGLSVEEIQGSMTTLIRAGFRDMGQLEEVMTGAAASAIAFGRSASDGFERVGDAAVTGLSAALNAIGVSENLGPAYDKYAASLNKTADSLTEAERTQVLYNLVTKATRTEVDALGSIQNEYVRSGQAADLAQQQLVKTLGQLTMPVVMRVNQVTAELMGTTTALLKVYQDGGDVLEALARKYPQLAGAISTLRPVLQQAGQFFTELGQTGREIFERTLLPLVRTLAPQIAGMVQAIAPQFARFTAVAREIGETARQAFERVIVPLIRTVAPVVTQMVRTIVPLLAQFAETFSAYFRMVVTAWERIALPVIQAIAPAVQTAVRLAGDVLGGLLGVVKGIFNAVRAAISGDWTGAWNIAQTAVGTALGKIQGVLDELLPKVWKVITDLAAGALTRAKAIGANLKDGLVAGLAGLAERLATDIGGAIERATSRLPDWAKRLLGITAIQAVVAQAASVAGAAADGAQQGLTGRTQASTQQAIAQQAAALPAGSFNLAAFQQAFMSRNDAKADTIVDYCARWVRDTLGDAAPQMRAQIDALFQANPEKYTDKNGKTGYVPTARSAYKNFQAAGLARDYSTTADLKPGDTVFYTDNGQNHTGVYIGAGQVRGNNRVSFKESGGTNPVGNVDIGKLGSVTGYVRLSDLEAYIRRATPAPSQPKATSAVPDAKPPPPPSKPPPPETPEVDPKIAKNRAALQKEIDEAAAKGRIEAAQRALEGLKRLQAEALDGATKSAAQRLAILERTGPQILAVEGRIARSTREQAVQAAGQWAKEELAKVGADGKAIEAERVRRVGAAYAVETEARKSAQSQQDLAVAALERQSAEEGKTRAREQAAIRAQIAEEGRQLSITKAQQTADRLKTLNGQELSAFKGTAQERLEVIQRQSQDEYLARMKVAQAVREQAEAAARNGPAQLRAGREQAAARDYENARLEAQATRQGIVKAATLEVTKAEQGYTAALNDSVVAQNAVAAKVIEAARKRQDSVRDLRGEYSKLADGIRKQVEAGTFDTEAKQKAQVAFNALGRAAKEAGLSQDEYVTGARQAVNVLISQGQAASDAAVRLREQGAALGELVKATRALDLGTLGSRTDADLSKMLNVAQFNNDAEMVKAILAEIEGRVTGTLKVQSEANQAFAELVGGEADRLSGAGNYADAAALLGAALEGLYDRAAQGEDAVDGINTVIDALNRLEVARKKFEEQQAGQAQRDFYQSLPAGRFDQKGGTNSPDNQNMTLPGQPAFDMDSPVGRVLIAEDEARATKKLREEVEALGDAQLETARASAIAAGDAVRLTAVIEEQRKRVERAEQAQRDYYQSLPAGKFDAVGGVNLPDSQNMQLPGVKPYTEEDARLALEVADAQGQLAAITREVGQAAGDTQVPWTAQITTLNALKIKYPELTAQIDQLIAKLKGLQTKSVALEKFNRYADYIAQVGVAFTQVGAAVGGDLGANISGFGVALQKGVDIAKDIASGNWFGAAMKAISALADAWGGYRRAQEEAAKAQKDFLGSFSLIDASTFSSFTTRSRGFWADLFGGGPEVVKQINESAASIAKTIESGVIGGFQNGIKAFLNGTGNLLDGIREGVRGAIIDAITQAVIQGAVIKGALGKLLTELTNTLADGGDASGVIAQIGAALPGIAQGLERTLAPLKDTIDRALPKTQTGTASSSQTFASGTSTLQAGTPQVVIDVLGSARDLLRGANEASRLMVEAARSFGGHVDRFGAHLDRTLGPHASSTAGAR